MFGLTKKERLQQLDKVARSYGYPRMTPLVMECVVGGAGNRNPAVKRLRKLRARLRDDKARKAAAVAKRERRMTRNQALQS